MALVTPKFGSLVPTQVPQLLDSNYLQWTDSTGTENFADFAQQYLPEIYEAEVERYGNRTLSGFLKMVGAEMPMTSDQVIWSEQNRLHISYEGVTFAAFAAGTNTMTIPATAGVTNVISTNDTIVIIEPATGKEAKAIVTDSGAMPGSALAAGQIKVTAFQGVGLENSAIGMTAGGSGDVKIFVYGSDYAKGSNPTRVSVEPVLTQYSNSPVIIRNQYVVSGSDAAQIGWVNVATEDGTDGYLWYLKAESETRLRFEDYLEMAMVEGEKSAITATEFKQPGTQGLFAAVQERGNTQVAFTPNLAEFDAILKNLDTQGAIEENMLFLNRETALGFDDMLAAVNGGYDGGTSFGLFENSAEMALNLGFSGFRRGSYDFYKTDWKYLNDASTRGAINGTSSIEGVLVPAGTSTVYDQVLGTNIRRPFLHVRYRASQTDDRRMKSWLTGSVGGANNSTLDAMEVNFLSERCLITQAANNFVLFKGA